jgi:hydroxymethylpyrimidine pyrophosphatase-like HAD family hydrolase
MAKLVTFDFDDTLTMPRWDEEEELWMGGTEPNKKTISAMKKFASKGYEVKIVTSRHGTSDHKRAIATFVRKYGLPIKDIIFTNGKWKADTLDKIGSILHYDDDKEEITRIKAKGIKVVEIPHPLGI